MYKRRRNLYPVFVIIVFFFFMLLHQADRLMIGSLELPISATFGLNKRTFGLVNSGAMLVATFLYPIWGYLYDRYARPKLLALASFIWGSTTWLSAIAPTYPTFLGTRAATGIDDSSYPGLYSMVADHFGPRVRGKVYGLLQVAQPIGYLIGMVLALMVAPEIGGWRSVYYITGSLGIVIAIVIFFGIKDVPRGRAEPEFDGMPEIVRFRFSWKDVKEIFKKKTMWFIFLQGFAGNFPWNVITVFFFGYLMEERGYDNQSVLFTMAPVVIILAGGYFIGGLAGDWLFRITKKGRIIVSSAGVILGAIFIYFALTTPVEARTLFFILMCLTAIFMPFSSPNVLATIFDVTPPDVRSTAQSVEYFIENIGAAIAPTITGNLFYLFGNMGTTILVLCVSAWIICFFLYLGALFTVDKDVKTLRQQMAQVAKQEKTRKAT